MDQQSQRQEQLQQQVKAVLQGAIIRLAAFRDNYMDEAGNLRRGVLYELLTATTESASLRFHVYRVLRKALFGSDAPADLSYWLETATRDDLKGLLQRAQVEVV